MSLKIYADERDSNLSSGIISPADRSRFAKETLSSAENKRRKAARSIFPTSRGQFFSSVQLEIQMQH
jgi:hypothetical protein